MKTSRQINAERKKEELPPLNFSLFRKVVKKLADAPMAYEQTKQVYADMESPCGTAACIGGWADILSGKGTPRLVSLNRAGDSLGISGTQWEIELDTERSVLFDGSPHRKWPAPYCSQWQTATSRQERAKVAIRYLTHIIKTGRVTS